MRDATDVTTIGYPWVRTTNRMEVELNGEELS